MSAINFKIDVKREQQNGEDRVLINLNGSVDLLARSILC